MGEPIDGNCRRKVNLTLLNGTGYIFNVEDYLFIRKHARVIGSMVGTPCTNVLGTDEPSLPAEFSPYETHLLIEQGFAQLISKITSSCDYRPDLKLKKIGNGVLENEHHVLLSKGMFFQDLAFYCKDSRYAELMKSLPGLNLIEISCANPKNHFGYVTSSPEVDEFKYRVFKDFWTRCLYVTGGDSFGADFLIYPGDPMQFHSSHIIIILKSPEIDPSDLISKVRAATVVNKHCVFAFLKPMSNGLETKIRYHTVVWDGDQGGYENDTIVGKHIDENDEFDGESDNEFDNKIDTEIESKFKRKLDTDVDSEFGTDVDSEFDTDIDSELVTDDNIEFEIDSDTEFETDINMEFDTDFDIEFDNESDSDVDTDMDTEIDTELDNETNTDSDVASEFDCDIETECNDESNSKEDHKLLNSEKDDENCSEEICKSDKEYDRDFDYESSEEDTTSNETYDDVLKMR